VQKLTGFPATFNRCARCRADQVSNKVRAHLKRHPAVFFAASVLRPELVQHSGRRACEQRLERGARELLPTQRKETGVVDVDVPDIADSYHKNVVVHVRTAAICRRLFFN
jgi:hypothetical protein